MEDVQREVEVWEERPISRRSSFPPSSKRPLHSLPLVMKRTISTSFDRHDIVKSKSTGRASKRGCFTCSIWVMVFELFREAYDARNDSTIVFGPVSEYLENHQRGTYKLPSRKMNDKANFRLWSNWSRHIMRTGSRRTITSVSTCGTVAAMVNFSMSTHDDLIVLFQ